MKTCKQCGQEKNLADYYAHPHYPDGKLPKCKECHRGNMLDNRRKNLDYYRRYDRVRGATPARIEKSAMVTAAYRRKNPERVAANNAVARAIKSGRIKAPEACWSCGSDVGICGHHASYDRDMRLAITWLCQACHKQVHEQTEGLALVPRSNG